MSLFFHLTHSKKSPAKDILESINSLITDDISFAAFDLDNTLLIGDIGDAVFAMLVKKGLISNFGWKDYQALIVKNKVKAYKHIIDLMQGLSIAQLEETTQEVMNRKKSFIVEGSTIPIPKPDLQMILILKKLKKRKISVYVVTASNEISARIICKKLFGIPESNVIGAEVPHTPKGLIKVSRKELTYGEGKVKILKKKFRQKPLVTGGDSPGDIFMLDYTHKKGIRIWFGNNDYGHR